MQAIAAYMSCVSPRIRLSICLAFCLASVAGALTGCGGGSGRGSTGASAVLDTSVTPTGRVYPAREGVIFVEYTADGSELQRSSVTMADGSFQFSGRLTGTRIEALYGSSTTRVEPVYSAQLVNARTSLQLEVTPLTTWYDQLVVNGVSKSKASAGVLSLIGSNCPALAGSSLDSKYLYASSSMPAVDHDWLLDAASAYLQAMRAVGIGPKLDFAGWSDTLGRNGALLSQLCAFSTAVSAPAWAAVQSNRLKQVGKVDAVDSSLLSASIAAARTQGLAVVARQIQQTEYPDQTAVLRASSNVAGRELDLSSDFVVAWYEQQSEGMAKVSAQEAAVLPATPGVSITFSGSVVKTLQASAANAGTAGMRLENTGAFDKSVHLVVNGQEMASLSSIIGQILAMPVAYAGEPLYRKAWRYVIAHRRDTQPLAVSFFQFQPDLWLRSVGSSYCEAQAAVLYRIWRAMGYEARVYGLTGHVTAEVQVDGKWMVFDPFLEAYYTDRQGQIVGVAELQQDPTLILKPQSPILPLNSVAYSQTIADIFSSTADNYIGYDYMGTEPQPLDETVDIPAGGYLEINSRTDVTLPSSEAGYEVKMSTAKLWVPPGYIGTIRLPLLLLDVTGVGSVRLLGRTVDASGNVIDTRGFAGLGSLDASATAPSIGDRLQWFYFHDSSEIGVSEIEINSSGDQGLILTLLVNPLYFQAQAQLTMRAFGADIDGLRFTAPAAL